MRDGYDKAQDVAVLACRSCGALDPGPREICTACGSDDLEIRRIRGRGCLVSSTIIRRPAAAFRDEGAFEVAVIDLDAGPRITARIMPDADLSPGQRVDVVGRRGNILYFAGEPT